MVEFLDNLMKNLVVDLTSGLLLWLVVPLVVCSVVAFAKALGIVKRKKLERKDAETTEDTGKLDKGTLQWMKSDWKSYLEHFTKEKYRNGGLSHCNCDEILNEVEHDKDIKLPITYIIKYSSHDFGFVLLPGGAVLDEYYCTDYYNPNIGKDRIRKIISETPEYIYANVEVLEEKIRHLEKEISLLKKE